MRITPIIERLRTTLSTWNNRIYGAAEWQAAEDRSRLVIPSLFVMYGGSTAKTISYESFDQEIDERLRVLVILDNTTDRTGKNAQDQVHLVREALFEALLNYQADPDAHHLHYVGDNMVEMDKARYFHVFEFKIIGRLTDEDGATTSLDNFNRFYADFNLTESTEENHPDIQAHIDDLYDS